MRMLETDATDVDIPVSFSDQQNINAFSRLNTRVDELVDELESVRKQVEDEEEVETEMELVDEDEVVRYKLDTTFLHLPASQVLEKLQASLEKLRARKDELEAEQEKIQGEMKELKGRLYAKFGSSINLER